MKILLEINKNDYNPFIPMQVYSLQHTSEIKKENLFQD